MVAYKVSEVARVLAVSDDKVRRWIDDGHLPADKTTSPITIEGTDVAQLAIDLAAGKLATDHGISTRNELSGIVTAIKKDTVMAQVDLQCGPYRIVSLISTEAVDEMGLEVGSLATGLVKATNVSLKKAHS